MSYRSRIYNHRNAQPPEGEKLKKPFFSDRRGAGAVDVKKSFFQGVPAADMPEEQGPGTAPKVQRLPTSEVEEEQGTNEEKQARNKGDKLRQENSAGSTRDGDKFRVQRQTAVPPTNPDAKAPDLTRGQIRDAIIYNNNRYGEASIRQIQDIVQATVTGEMNADTVQKIADYQVRFDQDPDGKIGPDTLRQLHGEMAAKGSSTDECINEFRVRVGGLVLTRLGAGRVRIQADVLVDIHFDPHCDCSRLQFRQFVSGTVTKNGVNVNNWFTTTPGGRLPAMGNWMEDGNTTLPNNGPYGHRNLTPNLGDVVDEYSDPDGTRNMRSGCIYEHNDTVGISDGPGVPGDNFVIDIRFIGEIRRDGNEIERRYWAVRGNINI